MRQVKSISLPKKLVDYIERQVRDEGYASTSEFIRALIRERQEKELLDSVRQAEEDVDAGCVYGKEVFDKVVNGEFVDLDENNDN